MKGFKTYFVGFGFCFEFYLKNKKIETETDFSFGKETVKIPKPKEKTKTIFFFVERLNEIKNFSKLKPKKKNRGKQDSKKFIIKFDI